ncbi:hypothetical protein LOC68_00890 [Blastopirellula sp. JC732]|uniref:DUF1795 domain-containing protein n=1 Tax=Blastopirellula sediminis TaxID=2894196 RepID=A0A9X1SDQ7_9BACT|nr:hypothetical protein [Blastopirellula sediminis]MCC9608258.1 hypothetical protein [Blastopirellula sediminis]MCC9626950.1 hypothetical protein [Blastopirellula sediminis]
MFQNRTAKGFFALTQLFVVAFFAIQSASTANAEEFVSNKHKFALTLPARWDHICGDETSETFGVYNMRSDLTEILIVNVTTASPEVVDGVTYPNLALATQKYIETIIPGAVFSRPRPLCVGGNYAWKFNYDWELEEGRAVTTHQWMVVNKWRLYSITWSAHTDATNAKEATAIVKDLKFR